MKTPKISLLLGSAGIILLLACPAFLAAAGDRIPVAVFRTDAMKNGAPEGWEIHQKAGTPRIQLRKEGDAFFLHLISDDQSAFGIRRELKVDISEYPYLNWRWKAVKLPVNGDVRKAETDDQALQLYIVFSPRGFPAKLNTRVLGYLWENKTPQGWTGPGPQLLGNMIRYVVLKNGNDKLNQWYGEKRNILEDYRSLFGDKVGEYPPGPTQGVQIYINTQHTKSEAEGYIGEVFFSRN